LERNTSPVSVVFTQLLALKVSVIGPAGTLPLKLPWMSPSDGAEPLLRK